MSVIELLDDIPGMRSPLPSQPQAGVRNAYRTLSICLSMFVLGVCFPHMPENSLLSLCSRKWTMFIFVSLGLGSGTVSLSLSLRCLSARYTARRTLLISRTACSCGIHIVSAPQPMIRYVTVWYALACHQPYPKKHIPACEKRAREMGKIKRASIIYLLNRFSCTLALRQLY